MRLVGYPRVSTEEQATEGLSLGAQRARFAAYAAAFDHEIVAIIDDAGVSAKSLKRPGLKRALKMLRDGQADGLLVTKLDRLTRSVIDVGTLVEKYFSERAGKHLLSIGDNIDTHSAAGRLMINLLMSVAQWEREAIAERTREALRHKRSTGARLGAVPLGFKRDGDRFIEDATEQRILTRVRELVAGGARLSDVRIALEGEGFKTKRGGDWHLTTIRKLIARATLAIAAVGMLFVFMR